MGNYPPRSFGDLSAPEQEYPPEQVERIKFLLKGFENGLNSPDIIGYHGSSIETLEYLFANGNLPGSSFNALSDTKPGVPEFSVFPLAARIDIKRHKDHLEAASIYAAALGQNHAFLKFLGLELNEANNDLINDEDRQEELIGQGKLTQRQIGQAYTFAIERNGLVFGVSKRILADFKHRPTLEGGELGELVIECPNGIDYTYLIGLEPQGQIEYKFLENLQNKFT